MKNRLLKISKYLGSQGLYEEAAQIKKIAGALDELYESDFKDFGQPMTGRRMRSSDITHPHMARPFTEKELETGRSGFTPASPWELGLDDSDSKNPLEYPRDNFDQVFSGRISAAFFAWCKRNKKTPDDEALADFLTTTHEGAERLGFAGGTIPRSKWKVIKDLVRQSPLFEGSDVSTDPRFEGSAPGNWLGEDAPSAEEWAEAIRGLPKDAAVKLLLRMGLKKQAAKLLKS